MTVSEFAHTSSTRAINAAIRKAGVNHVELCGGNGYQYFVYSDGVTWEDRSVYVCYVRDLTVGEWVAQAIEFETDTLRSCRRLDTGVQQ